MLLRYRMITLGAGALLAFAAHAASPTPTVLHAKKFDVSRPLRDVIRDLPPNYGTENEGTVIPNIFIKPQSPANAWTIPDYSGVQRTPTGSPAPALGLAFNAIGNPTACGGCIPPDTNGDVSDQYYFQWVNNKFAIYNKSTGAVVQAPTAGNSFFAGFGGICQTSNSGDPIALWDAQAHRWVVSQFTGTNEPYSQCVAVSQTADPLGAYYRYQFIWPNFGDYPHMGIWTEENHRQNAYLLTTHEFQVSPQAFLGAALIAMERDKMLAGDPSAAVVRFPGFDAYGVQAIHLTGPKEAPGGSCPTFVHFDFSVGNYRFWDMCLDWTTPANSTISAANTVDDASPFFPYLDSIAQLGTTAVLDSFGSNTMYRATARAFSKDAPTRISLVINHVVQGSALNAGVKWLHFNLQPAVEPVGVTDRIFGDGYEGTPLPTVVPQTVMTKTLVDEGTYAIADGQNRWMGGIAIDASQNIGLGFSKSSSTIRPQIMYTARRATDSPGTMRDEQTCTAGIANGSQTDSAGRWGDYSSMSVDPVDQCTFYFTTEYYATSSARNFSTRVCTFKFPDCGTPDFLLVNETPKRVEVCSATAGGDPTWTVRAGVLNGFNAPVTLTEVGIPGGTSASFSANPIAAPGSSVMTLVNGATIAAGEYAFSVDGVSGALTRSASMSLGVSTAAAGAPSLTSPANNATGIKILPTLNWTAAAGALEYTVEVATDPAFANIVRSATVSGTSWKVTPALNQSTPYYWRVTPTNYCGAGATSAVFRFDTGIIGQCPSGTTPTTVFADNFQGGVNGWTTVGSGATDWSQQLAPAGSGLTTTVWGVPNNDVTSDRGLVSPTIPIPATSQATFLIYDTWHNFETDGPTGCYDNATLDIKVGAGAFTYVEGSSLYTDPYDGSAASNLPNAGLPAWCHIPAGAINSIVDLDDYVGQNVQLRFRALSDANTTADTEPTGFYIDNLSVKACIP